MKKCKYYFDKMSEYLDGELGVNVCHEIEAHLKECPECRHCADSLKKTIQLCRETGKEKVPSEMRARLKSALQRCLNENPCSK